ncbi:MAG: hypothetical protein HY055_09865 [Magnetospirillum sp.]|nr:hypothetical protein [Magnetospirillum sp.]
MTHHAISPATAFHLFKYGEAAALILVLVGLINLAGGRASARFLHASGP